MGFSYRPLFILMAQKGMKKKDLMMVINTSPATIAKLEKGEYISGEILEKICAYFDCQPGDVMEYVRESQSKSATKPAPANDPAIPSSPAGMESPEPRTQRSLSPAPEDPQERQKTALEIYEEALAERRKQEPDANWEFREKLHEEARKEREEGIELRRKLAKEHEELLRKRAIEASEEEDSEVT